LTGYRARLLRFRLLSYVPYLISRLDYSIYEQSGMYLTVPLLLVISYLGFIFEYRYLVSFDFPQGSSRNFSTLNIWITHENITLASNEQHILQLHRFTLRFIEALNFYRLFWSNLVLLATLLNYGVNFNTSALDGFPFIRQLNSLLLEGKLPNLAIPYSAFGQNN
jgi:hypothetical protein